MKEFHYYLPYRIFDRELSVHRNPKTFAVDKALSVHYYPSTFSVAFGSKSLVLGKWFIALEGLDREER